VAIFSKHSLEFLKSLKRHNNKAWFEAHRSDYEEHVREPMRTLIAEMDARLARFAPEIAADPRRSMFRIHRDIRFSKDKSPYKTNAACWFFHAGASRQVGQEAEGGSAGFYFHLEPGAAFAGGGLWRPPRGLLAKLREGIAEDPKGFQKIVTARPVVTRFGGLSSEDVLRRMPGGYGEDDPGAQWLKHQSFTLGRRLTDAQVTSTRLPDLLEADFALMTPLVRWLNQTIGLPAARRR
jgi:uncharacterized protein (TIGR02453 family)